MPNTSQQIQESEHASVVLPLERIEMSRSEMSRGVLQNCKKKWGNASDPSDKGDLD